jgi:general secretion pathway protein K
VKKKITKTKRKKKIKKQKKKKRKMGTKTKKKILVGRMNLKLNNLIKDQKGMALLLTILISVVLTTVVIEYNYDANINIDIAENYKNKLKADYLAKSGIRFARFYLSSGAENLLGDEIDEVKPLLHGKPIPLGSGVITIKLEGEDGRININKLVESQEVKDMFINLLDNLDIDYTVYYSLVDWIDTDDEVFEDNGAEDDYYQELSTPYPCKNAPLDSIDELRLIKGVDEEVFRELKKYCTIYSGALININEASKEVLLSLCEDITEYDVDKIIQTREEEKYTNINELEYLDKVYDDIKGKITTEDSIYKITSVGVVDEIRYKITNYVQKEESGTKLLYSRED